MYAIRSYYVEGATLNLLSAGQGTLSISTDQTAIKENIQSFADGYNKVISFSYNFV